MPAKLRVLVVGLGHMGVTHAKAYDHLDGYDLAGLCRRSIARRNDIIKSWPTWRASPIMARRSQR